jgi:cytochrome c oxidase subunit 3
MTGLHALHVIIGILALGLLWLRGLRGSLASVGHRVGLTGLYWHLVDIVWIFLFPLLYLS